MAFKLVVIIVVSLLIGHLAFPSFYLMNAVGRETQDGMRDHLGQPLQSVDDSIEGTVWTYQQTIPPLCVEYTLTFKRENQILSKWIWNWCLADQLLTD